MTYVDTTEKYVRGLLAELEQGREHDLETYKVYIYQREDMYAKYEVEKVRTMSPKDRELRDLQRLSPLGLYRDRELIRIYINDVLSLANIERVLEYIQEGREFIFEVKDEVDVETIHKNVSKLDREGIEYFKVFKVKDFKEKVKWCEARIEEWLEGKPIDRGVKSALKYYMFKNEDKWNDIELMCKVEDGITKEVVDIYFEGVEHFSVEEFTDNVIFGNKKLKTIQQLDYLLTVRGYKPFTVLNIIRRRLEVYLEITTYLKEGVITGENTSTNELLKRAEFLGYEVSKVASSDGRFKVIDNLTILTTAEVNEVYSKVMNLYKKKLYMITETDLLVLIREVIESRGKERVKDINGKLFLLTKNRRK